MNSLSKMENFISRGWKPEEISLEGYLSICSKLKELNDELQSAAFSSDEKYNELKPHIEEVIESLLKDFNLDSSNNFPPA